MGIFFCIGIEDAVMVEVVNADFTGGMHDFSFAEDDADMDYSSFFVV